MNTTSREAMLPCPFCGSIDIVKARKIDAKCNGCGASTQYFFWNDRAQPAQADVSELMKQREEMQGRLLEYAGRITELEALQPATQSPDTSCTDAFIEYYKSMQGKWLENHRSDHRNTFGAGYVTALHRQHEGGMSEDVKRDAIAELISLWRASDPSNKHTKKYSESDWAHEAWDIVSRALLSHKGV